MSKRHLLATTLAATLAFSGAVSWRAAETLLWFPANLSIYDEDALRALPEQGLTRYLTERISGRISETSTSPAVGAIMMSEVLGGFYRLYSRYGQVAAVLGGAEIFAVWDKEGASSWLDGFTQIDPATALAGLSPEILAEIETLKAESLRLSSLDPAAPQRPEMAEGAAGLAWTSHLGMPDPDAGIAALSLAHPVDLTRVSTPPAENSFRDKRDMTQLRLATRLISDRQLENAIWWHGSGGFEKDTQSGGINPSDQWLSIAFAHASSGMSEMEFAGLSSALADVLSDAMIATWKVKYRDWAARPSMRDPRVSLRLGDSPSPSHVSEHATAAGAAAAFLSVKDPDNAEIYRGLAHDIARARIWGGVHTASEVEAGFELGAMVAGRHLDMDLAPLWRSGGLPAIDSLLLSGVEKGLDGSIRAIRGIRAQIFGRLSFSDQSAQAPGTDTQTPLTDLHDAYAGSLALADLDGDGLKEVLVSGRDKLRLYRNASTSEGIDFELTWEMPHEGLSGAYFTQGLEGEIDGVLGFGESEPVFYGRWDDLEFAPSGQTVHGFPFDGLSVQGALFFDADGDGLQDALLTQTGFPFDAAEDRDFSRSRKPNILLRRHFSGFEFDQYLENPSGSSLSGGHIDLNRDGLAERILVSDAGRLQVVDGATGRDLPLSEGVDKVIFGTSVTPIEVAGRPAFHVGNTYHGPDWPYGVATLEGEVDGDLLIAWDEAAGELVDLAQGQLQYGPGEWGWGSAAGDLDGDGLEDLVSLSGFVVNSPYPPRMRIFLQEPEGGFKAQNGYLDFDLSGSAPRAVVLDDLDGDGDLDVLVNASQQVRMWENTTQAPARAARVDAGAVRGYLTQVIDEQEGFEGQVPAHLRPAAIEDIFGQ